MQILTNTEVAQALSARMEKPMVLISFTFAHELFTDQYNYYEELKKAAPYLDFEDDLQAIADGQAVIICEDDDECDRVFRMTVGDDGPTTLNPYDGPVRVYAVTINSDGELENENT